MEGLVAPVSLGDKRLDNRYHQLLDRFVKQPTASIPEACGDWKTTKAAYRFFSNDTVSAEKMMTAQYEETQRRITETDGIILVAQDTTDVDYTTHKKTKGLGYLQGERLFGIKVHSGLAISANGVPLGLLHQKRWIREVETFGKGRMKGRQKRPLEEKESNRWIETVRVVEQNLQPGRDAVVIGDRESDLYELFAMKRKATTHLLIRAKHNRYLWGTDKRLFAKVMDAPVTGRIQISVHRSRERKARKATIALRYTPVTLASKNSHGAIRLWAVAATEEAAPKGVQPIQWILLTSVPITTGGKAIEVVGWYAKRWLIERFHYTLKSGCRIEELQLQEKNRLERAVVLYTLVAWQLLWLTYEAREHPEESVTRILTEEEWILLCAVSKQKKPPQRTMHEAVRMLAKLGGFLGRRGDREPGVKTLWIGIRRFHDILYGWQMAKQKDVGNG